MTTDPSPDDSGDILGIWTLPFAATLGSAVRAKGIFQAVRTRLPSGARKALELRGAVLTLRLVPGVESSALVEAVGTALERIETRPVIPREIEDILAIKPTERHRWLKDGRLRSAGTRTVKLRGRAKITFHVFDPALVENLLNTEQVLEWREEDAIKKAEARREAAWKARVARQQRLEGDPPPAASADGDDRPNLIGWEEFERDGLLR